MQIPVSISSYCHKIFVCGMGIWSVDTYCLRDVTSRK